jgi:hypothetical protein
MDIELNRFQPISSGEAEPCGFRESSVVTGPQMDRAIDEASNLQCLQVSQSPLCASSSCHFHRRG